MAWVLMPPCSFLTAIAAPPARTRTATRIAAIMPIRGRRLVLGVGDSVVPAFVPESALASGREGSALRFVLAAGAGAVDVDGFAVASVVRVGASACTGVVCVGSGWAVVRWVRAAWTAGSGDVRSQSTRSG